MRFIRVAIVLMGLVLVVLGVHGLYVHFSLWDVLLSSASGGWTGQELLTVWTVPSPMGDWVEWMTGKGIQSWVIPAVFVVGGCVLIKCRYDVVNFVRGLFK